MNKTLAGFFVCSKSDPHNLVPSSKQVLYRLVRLRSAFNCLEARHQRVTYVAFAIFSDPGISSNHFAGIAFNLSVSS
ncbi:MAG: hypothetical protein DRH90_25960, partial [Deltaproteobacteria bacterium]